MSREQRQREYWDHHIPKDWEFAGLSDAHRWINRGQEREIISLRTLQRRADAGYMGAIGGRRTGFGAYRIRRTDLIEFLVKLDVLVAPDRDPVESVGSESRVGGVKPARTKRRRGRRNRLRPAAAPPPNGARGAQISLFEGE